MISNQYKSLENLEKRADTACKCHSGYACESAKSPEIKEKECVGEDKLKKHGLRSCLQ